MYTLTISVVAMSSPNSIQPTAAFTQLGLQYLSHKKKATADMAATLAKDDQSAVHVLHVVSE